MTRIVPLFDVLHSSPLHNATTCTFKSHSHMRFNFGVIKEVINLLIANSYDACKNIICADGQIARCPLNKMYCWWGQLQERLSCRLC